MLKLAYQIPTKPVDEYFFQQIDVIKHQCKLHKSMGNFTMAYALQQHLVGFQQALNATGQSDTPLYKKVKDACRECRKPTLLPGCPVWVADADTIPLKNGERVLVIFDAENNAVILEDMREHQDGIKTATTSTGKTSQMLCGYKFTMQALVPLDTKNQRALIQVEAVN